MIQNPLALQLLEGKIQDGDHVIVTVGPSGTIVFEKPGARVPAGVA
jgi:hypothetical protein